jgi:ubiquinone/menaquinone biosynthesis C-methylase UbiE
VSHNKEYVAIRVHRTSNADLARTPNKWIANFPGTETRSRVLDIACGMGYDSIAWAKMGKKVVGIDYNYDLLKQASRLTTNAGLEVNFVAADATRLPFRDGAFDISFSENLFEHVPEWEKVVTETNRVSAEGGTFFVRTLNKHCPINPEINHFHFYPWFPETLKRPILRWIMRNRPAWVNYTAFPAVNWFTHRGLSESMRRAGFEAYEIFDLVGPHNVSARKLFLLTLLKKHPALRYLIYPLIRSVQILAVKTQSPK